MEQVMKINEQLLVIKHQQKQSNPMDESNHKNHRTNQQASHTDTDTDIDIDNRQQTHRKNKQTKTILMSS